MFTCEACVSRLYWLNEYATSFLMSVQSPLLTQFFVYVTDLFSPVNIIMYALVLILVLWLHKKNTHAKQFIFALASVSVAILITKYSLQIPRPPHALIEESGYTFASGHAAISAVFFLLIAHAYKSHIKIVPLRYLFVLLCIICVLVVGVSRVYLGVHYTTDVIGGYLIGTIIYALSMLLFG